MDESGFESETLRPFGYAPIGKPCIDSYNWQGKKRTNVIGALYEKALFALDYFEKISMATYSTTGAKIR